MTDPRFVNTIHALINYFSYEAYGAQGGMEIELIGELPPLDPESRGEGFGFTKTNYRPDPGMTDHYLTMCANIRRIKESVQKHRWEIIYDLLHPESRFFTLLTPGCFTPPEGKPDHFHPSFSKYDSNQRWSHGWTERLFNSAVYRIADVLYPKRKTPQPKAEASDG